jgi:hypothetical protein
MLSLSEDHTYCSITTASTKDKAARVCDWHILLVDGLVMLTMMVRYTTLKLSTPLNSAQAALAQNRPYVRIDYILCVF